MFIRPGAGRDASKMGLIGRASIARSEASVAGLSTSREKQRRLRPCVLGWAIRLLVRRVRDRALLIDPAERELVGGGLDELVAAGVREPDPRPAEADAIALD